MSIDTGMKVSLLFVVLAVLSEECAEYSECSVYPNYVNLTKFNSDISLGVNEGLMYMAISGNSERQAFVMKQNKTQFSHLFTFPRSRNSTALFSRDGLVLGLLMKGETKIYRVGGGGMQLVQNISEEGKVIHFSENNTLFLSIVGKDGVSGDVKVYDYKAKSQSFYYQYFQTISSRFSVEWLTSSQNYLFHYTQGSYTLYKRQDQSKNYSPYSNFTQWNHIYDMTATNQFLSIPYFEQHSMLPSKNYVSIYKNDGSNFSYFHSIGSEQFPAFSIASSHESQELIVLTGNGNSAIFHYVGDQFVQGRSIAHGISGYPLFTDLREKQGYIAIHSRDQLRVYCPSAKKASLIKE